jgi:hypothetical protein
MAGVADLMLEHALEIAIGEYIIWADQPSGLFACSPDVSVWFDVRLLTTVLH